jgi:hypothetical protein
MPLSKIDKIVIVILAVLALESAFWSLYLNGTGLHSLVWGLLGTLLLLTLMPFKIRSSNELIILASSGFSLAILKEFYDLKTFDGFLPGILCKGISTGFSFGDIMAGAAGFAIVFFIWTTARIFWRTSPRSRSGEIPVC